MRRLKTMLTMAAFAGCFIASDRGEARQTREPRTSFQAKNYEAVRSLLQANSLCARTEHIIFSCRVRRSRASAANSSSKIVSLCASPDLDKEHGYLQYRFGLPGRVELEFPHSRTGTQQMFQYTHYMRYQVDLTEINFTIDGYQYQIYDTYNGEEKPTISEEGVSVTAPGKEKEVSFICRGKAQADYASLQDTLLRE